MDIKPAKNVGPTTPTRNRLWLVALLLLVVFAPVHADNSLPEYNAVYMVEKLGTVIGKSTYSLRHTDKGIHFSQVTELVGIAALLRSDRIEEDSWLVYDGDLLLLKKYKYIHSGSKKNRNVDLEIVWTTDNTSQKLSGQMTGTSAGKTISSPVDVTVRDALSFQLALRHDAMVASTSTKFNGSDSSVFDYPVLSKGKLKQYQFTRVGTEDLDLIDKTIATIKLERKNNNRTTRLWLAPELHYVPVKITHTKEGKSDMLMTLDKINFNPS